MFGSEWDDYFKSKYGDDAVEWVSETIYDIDRLKNTNNFNDGALNHILEGELNARGNAVGFHYEGMPTQKGSIITGTETLPNSKGVYEATVEVNGVLKNGNGGKSTFSRKILHLNR